MQRQRTNEPFAEDQVSIGCGYDLVSWSPYGTKIQDGSVNKARFLNKRQDGFSLVELLIAMAILISILGSVMLLFNNASNLVSQAKMNLKGYEIARSASTRLELDITKAFSASELGEQDLFYGGEKGMIFVGPMQDGQLGRFTYATTPSDSFTVTLQEDVAVLVYRAVRQDLIEDDNFGGPRTVSVELLNYLETQTNLITNAQWTIFDAAAEILYVNSSGIPADLYMEPIETFEAWQVANGLETPPDYPVYVELEVRIETASLLRYVESGVRELEWFPEIFPNRNGLGLLLPPLIGPDNPAVLEDGEIYVAPDVPLPPDLGTIGNPVTRELNRALRYQGLDAPGMDLRAQIAANGAAYTTLNFDLTEMILRVKLREFWLGYASQDAVDPFVDLLGDYAESLPGGATLRDNFVLWDPAGSYTNKDIGAYELANGILIGGYLKGATGLLDVFDIFDTRPIFNYIDSPENTGPSHSFNTLDELPGYRWWRAGGGAIGPDTGTLDALLEDAALDGSYAGQGYGSPVYPRAPYAMQLGFWIALPAKSPGVGDFRVWFEQYIEIPGAFTRGN
jgi:prepilin-type N-terminal cleavage/methylation domain-containing protein